MNIAVTARPPHKRCEMNREYTHENYIHTHTSKTHLKPSCNRDSIEAKNGCYAERILYLYTFMEGGWECGDGSENKATNLKWHEMHLE